MILRLAPSLVGDYGRAQPVPSGCSLAPAACGWTTRDRSVEGHIGQPHLATPEKGEALFRWFTGCVGDFLERVIAWNGRSWDG